MTSVKEFTEVRKSIEALADEIILFVERRAMQDSRHHLIQANEQLEVLKTMVANDVQGRAANRLSRQLAGLGTKLETIKAKTSMKKGSIQKNA